MRVLLTVFGWLLFVMWSVYNNGMWYRDRCNPVEAIYVSFMLDYCSFLNLADDLIIANIFGLVYSLINIALIIKFYCHA